MYGCVACTCHSDRLSQDKHANGVGLGVGFRCLVEGRRDSTPVTNRHGERAARHSLYAAAMPLANLESLAGDVMGV